MRRCSCHRLRLKSPSTTKPSTPAPMRSNAVSSGPTCCCSTGQASSAPRLPVQPTAVDRRHAGRLQMHRHETHRPSRDPQRHDQAGPHLLVRRRARQRDLADVLARCRRRGQRLSPSEGKPLHLVLAVERTHLELACRRTQSLAYRRRSRHFLNATTSARTFSRSSRAICAERFAYDARRDGDAGACGGHVHRARRHHGQIDPLQLGPVLGDVPAAPRAVRPSGATSHTPRLRVLAERPRALIDPPRNLGTRHVPAEVPGGHSDRLRGARGRAAEGQRGRRRSNPTSSRLAGLRTRLGSDVPLRAASLGRHEPQRARLNSATRLHCSSVAAILRMPGVSATSQ